ncbi:MAG: GntR family transcriptional regulator [Propionicimonas sp.]|uniref:GntR family transcriptional regulator n=1 Tax=Propionicimonas sp. TaxID=1955623 RepID=UPI002B1FD376|nr:GntR family transcriptional regulator [Propionicimonas sp.]MEA4944396.1 GntR family transcriptional regulator [Propionicimonas sp.]
MATPIELIQQVALGDQVADTLRRLIISGELAADTRLVEIPLAEQFGVSRGPIREAFVRLESEGLITTGRRGAFVVGMTDRDIDELYSLRETIEQFAVSLIINQRAGLDWALLEASVSRMREAAAAGEHQAFSKADIGFHSAIYELAGHRRLLDVWRAYEKTFEVVLDQSGRHGLDLQQGAQDHADLLDGLRHATAEECHEAVQTHLENAHQRLRGIFGGTADLD